MRWERYNEQQHRRRQAHHLLSVRFARDGYRPVNPGRQHLQQRSSAAWDTSNTQWRRRTRNRTSAAVRFVMEGGFGGGCLVKQHVNSAKGMGVRSNVKRPHNVQTTHLQRRRRAVTGYSRSSCGFHRCVRYDAGEGVNKMEKTAGEGRADELAQFWMRGGKI